MVALNPRFTLLAVFCSLATLSLSPLSASAVAIQGRHSSSSSKHAVAGNLNRKHSPVLPLPSKALKKSVAQTKDKKTSSKKGKQLKPRLTNILPIRASLHLANLAFGKAKRYHHEADQLEVDVNLPTHVGILETRNYHTQAHLADDYPRAHVARHHHHVDKKVIVKGDDAHVHVHQRSSVVIPSGGGRSYLVSPTRHASITQRSIGSMDSQAYFASASDDAGAPGRVDVMSTVASSEAYKKIASLLLDHDGTFNASPTNSTELIMINATPRPGCTASVSGSDTRLVMLQVSVFDSSSPRFMNNYCATTNMPDGSTMTATPCSDPQSVDPAQVFAFNPKSSVIQPMECRPQDINPLDSPTDSGSAPAARSIFGERDSYDSSKSQNVTLMFVPKAPEVANAADAPGSSQVTVVTATSTMTTTYTLTASMTTLVSAADVTSTSTVSMDSMDTSAPASVSAADASPTSAMVSSSIPAVTVTSTMSAAAVDSTSTAASSSSSIETPTVTISAAGATDTSSAVVVSSSSAVSSVTPAATLEALDVQVVAPSSSSGVASTTVTSMPTTPTSSMDAVEVASRIAAAFASSVEVVSTTTTPTATAAASSSTTSSTVSSSVPPLVLRGTEPYTWMFKKGKE